MKQPPLIPINLQAWLKTHFASDNIIRKIRCLKAKVTTHLFIVCPNNSGSTFLKNALATSQFTWNLQREGQNTKGFAGPVPVNKSPHLPLLWASDNESIRYLSDMSLYNWPKIKYAWYGQANANSNSACVFVEKSPPFLLNVGMLADNFENAKFIIMVRNPYAVVEGICRRKGQPGLIDKAARHVVTCLAYQRKNIESYGSKSVYFRYEDMCDTPRLVEKKLENMIPELGDLNLIQKIPVKGAYNEYLKNMNAQQIGRLDKGQISRINETLKGHEGILDFFGYQII